MKLGASYNLWDCWELLPMSILRIRPHVDFITVVFQEKSNYDVLLDKLTECKNMLSGLIENKMIDKLIIYKRQYENPMANEAMKRVIGLEESREAGMSHHLSIDADEIYVGSELAAIKKHMELNTIEFTACKLQTYWKTIEYRLDPPEEYYVTLIHRIDNNNFYFAQEINRTIHADPTRIFPVTYHCYDRSEIEMHHLSHVRMNYRQKLMNSTAKHNFPPGSIDKVVKCHKKWKYPKPAMVLGAEIKEYKIIRKGLP